MTRRGFVLTSIAACLVPWTARAAGAGFVEYDGTDPISRALADGKTVLVDYAADWCSTCARQERVINALRQDNPAYDQNIVFVRVDWDAYRGASVTTDRNIPRRSTLILLKGDQELGRLVAGTRERDIKALLDRGLDTAGRS